MTISMEHGGLRVASLLWQQQHGDVDDITCFGDNDDVRGAAVVLVRVISNGVVVDHSYRFYGLDWFRSHSGDLTEALRAAISGEDNEKWCAAGSIENVREFTRNETDGTANRR